MYVSVNKILTLLPVNVFFVCALNLNTFRTFYFLTKYFVHKMQIKYFVKKITLILHNFCFIFAPF